MASFSYKYFSVEDPENSLFLTWETGYKNLKVYYQGKIIKEIATPQELLKGVIFDTDELQNVTVQLMRERPMVVVVKVNGKVYKPENKIAGRGELKGLINLFWVIFALGTIASIREINSISPFVDNFTIVLVIIIDSVIVLSYGYTAIMLTREKAWSYFIGGSVYILSSLLVLFLVITSGFNVGTFIGLSIRLFIIIYIIRFFPTIMEMMRQNNRSEEFTQDVLDDF